MDEGSSLSPGRLSSIRRASSARSRSSRSTGSRRGAFLGVQPESELVAVAAPGTKRRHKPKKFIDYELEEDPADDEHSATSSPLPAPIPLPPSLFDKVRNSFSYFGGVMKRAREEQVFRLIENPCDVFNNNPYSFRRYGVAKMMILVPNRQRKDSATQERLRNA